MYQERTIMALAAITRNVKVSVEQRFAPERSNPARRQWFFVYTIEIKNEGNKTVQLMHRHWVITNAHGEVEEVRGPGVVGEQPVLRAGQSFRYSSGCPLQTPFGSMVGTYQMVDEDGQEFDAQIPAFALRDLGTMQ
jgi:ApaG protein